MGAPIDPELLSILAAMPSIEWSIETLPAIRAAADATYAPVDPIQGCSAREVAIPSPGGHAIASLLYTPVGSDPSGAAVLHFHAGGYAVGHPLMNDAEHRLLVAETGCVVLSVAYRLAPESPFPAALDDARAALEWMRRSAGALGIEIDRIGVKGESAGGGLAASLAIADRDEGGKLAFQHLFGAMLDDRTVLQAQRDDGPSLWPPDRNAFAWRALLGREPGGDDVPAFAAPARVDSVAGLPATFIAVGALDLFRHENVAYAERLVDAGVAVELHLYRGAVHGFEFLPGPAVSDRARRDSAEALRRALGR